MTNKFLRPLLLIVTFGCSGLIANGAEISPEFVEKALAAFKRTANVYENIHTKFNVSVAVVDQQESKEVQTEGRIVEFWSRNGNHYRFDTERRGAPSLGFAKETLVSVPEKSMKLGSLSTDKKLAVIGIGAQSQYMDFIAGDWGYESAIRIVRPLTIIHVLEGIRDKNSDFSAEISSEDLAEQRYWLKIGFNQEGTQNNINAHVDLKRGLVLEAKLTAVESGKVVYECNTRKEFDDISIVPINYVEEKQTKEPPQRTTLRYDRVSVDLGPADEDVFTSVTEGIERPEVQTAEGFYVLLGLGSVLIATYCAYLYRVRR
jgi:hypothetical protein